jgi:3-phosphoshikimate 1-carboxyvinyltransferase
MIVSLKKSTINNNDRCLEITGSKSESNRLLILQSLLDNVTINNLSNSDDTLVLQKSLKSSSNIIDVHHAGTAMRFLTAYFAIQKNKKVILTGSDRMKDRPISVLVDALRFLGADISYEGKDGFPPLHIRGKDLLKSEVSLKANVSSQYISALLLIGSVLDNGLKIYLEGEVTSMPYIKMTLGLLNNIGVEAIFEGNLIQVLSNKKCIESSYKKVIVESDWSSASYFYSLIALSEIGTSLRLSSFNKNSLQGDVALVEIFKQYGVQTVFSKNTIQLKKVDVNLTAKTFHLENTPDIAQTIAVTSFGLGVSCDLYGLHTLKIKETDRLEALKVELEKLGGIVIITKDSLHLSSASKINENVSINTYQDHRMAMAFAPLALKTALKINNAEVVSKSFPGFWEDLKSLGLIINKI